MISSCRIVGLFPVIESVTGDVARDLETVRGILLSKIEHFKVWVTVIEIVLSKFEHVQVLVTEKFYSVNLVTERGRLLISFGPVTRRDE